MSSIKVVKLSIVQQVINTVLETAEESQTLWPGEKIVLKDTLTKILETIEKYAVEV